MQSREAAERDYGTNCKDCERYKVLGDVCVVEHGKKFLWEFCRDFQPRVMLPDYNELMRSVRNDMALERKKLKEKKERERKKKLKERLVLLEAKKKARRARLRKKRLREKERQMKLERKLVKPEQQTKETVGRPRTGKKVVIMTPTVSKIKKAKRVQKTESKPHASQTQTATGEDQDSSQGESKDKISQMSNTPNTASSASATA